MIQTDTKVTFSLGPQSIDSKLMYNNAAPNVGRHH